MKTLNAKRISAVAAGAALLAVGLAFAGTSASGLTYGNIPIITAQGAPNVQIVVGSKAQPSDGVDAGNLAAAIGNLAWTSVPVTTVINSTLANKLVTVQVTSSGSTGSIANGQVWLNETGKSGVAAGTYSFSTLIGSVINEGITKSAPLATKSLSNTIVYSHPEWNNYNAAGSTVSPYLVASGPPFSTSISAGSSGNNGNGGGITFGGLTKVNGTTSNTMDNIMLVNHNSFPSLLSNQGTYGESEYLWVSGVPVYAQNATAFISTDTDVAYQVIFNNPINLLGSNNAINNAAFQFLGQTWTIISGMGAYPTGGSGAVTSGSYAAGGKIQVASSLVPTQAINVGNTIPSGAFNVTLVDLGQTNQGGTAPAIVNVEYQGQLVPHGYQYSIWPGNTQKFNTTTGQTIYVHVNTTSPGLYYYAKSAQIELWSNVYNLTNNGQYNKTINPGWTVDLLWTNKSTGTTDNSLYSIVMYNTTSFNLKPGQSKAIAQSPSPWSLGFAGDITGSNFDAVSMNLSEISPQTSWNYTNTGVSATNLNVKWLMQPIELLTVQSQIPLAFTYGSQTSSKVLYDLTPYVLNEVGNVLALNSGWGLGGGGPAGNTISLSSTTGTSIAMVYNGAGQDSNAWLNGNVVVYIRGRTISSTGVVGSTNTTASNTVYSTIVTGNALARFTIPTAFFNITDIYLNKPLPAGGSLWIGVGSANVFYSLATQNTVTLPATTAATNVIAYLTGTGPGLLYYQNGQSNYTLNVGGGVNYQQYNGEQSVPFTLSAKTVTGSGQQMYYTYTINEIAVPNNPSIQDSITYGFKNSTAGIADANLFMLNYSGTGTKANVTYLSTQGASIQVPQGFRTERGSEVATVSGSTPRTGVVDIAKSEHYLGYTLGSAGSNAVTSYTICPAATGAGIGVGGSLSSCGIANTTVYKISGNVTLGSGATYSIGNLTGLSKAITTNPSSVDSVTLLSNLGSTAPLVVLDSNANPASNLILIGSGYVNSLSAQLQQAENINITGPSSPSVMQAFSGTGTAGGKILLAGYSAQNTTTEVNAFIQWMYNQVAAGKGT